MDPTHVHVLYYHVCRRMFFFCLQLDDQKHETDRLRDQLARLQDELERERVRLVRFDYEYELESGHINIELGSNQIAITL